jgi:hypothetical protein
MSVSGIVLQFALEHATKALMRSRVIALLFLYPRGKMGVCVVNAMPLYPRERDPVPRV